MTKTTLLKITGIAACLGFATLLVAEPGSQPANKKAQTAVSAKTGASNRDWKEILSPERYHVMREKGTEPAFQNKYWDEKAKGIYRCAACGEPLFSSATKFHSGTGWPSFYQPLAGGHVKTKVDSSVGMSRTEVVCANCGGHLGHEFNDSPKPTGKRFCMNSLSLKLEQK